MTRNKPAQITHTNHPIQTKTTTKTKNPIKPIRGKKDKPPKEVVGETGVGKVRVPFEGAVHRYERFAIEYIKDFNGTQAYIRAGLPGNCPDVRASQLLANVKVQEIVYRLKEERLKAIKVDANYVLLRLTEIDQMDCLDILDDSGAIKPISKWPKIWRQFISGFEMSEVFEGYGDDRAMVGLLKKIKWPDKTKNLELIGKHTNVMAFKERVEHTGPNGGPIQQTIDLRTIDPIEASRQYQQLIEGM